MDSESLSTDCCSLIDSIVLAELDRASSVISLWGEQKFRVTLHVAEGLKENRQTGKENMRPDWKGRPSVSSAVTGASSV